MFGLTPEELALFGSLNTPEKIYDFIVGIPNNFEDDGIDTCRSPRQVLKVNKCHCIEAAILAAAMLRVNGYPPLILDLTATPDDFDHVITVYQKEGKWGAISKANHYSLRYREPVYESIRELAMSYFHEYFNASGKKTLRSYSDPVDLTLFDPINWMATEKELWAIASFLDKVPHHQILTKSQIANLRDADEIEKKASEIVEYYDYHAAIARNLAPPFFAASVGADKFTHSAPFFALAQREKQIPSEVSFYSKAASDKATCKGPFTAANWGYREGLIFLSPTAYGTKATK